MTKSLIGFFFICILTSCSSLSNSKHNERLAQLQNIEEQKQSVKKPGVSYDEFTRIWGTGESMSTEGESISMTYEEEAPPLKVVFIKGKLAKWSDDEAEIARQNKEKKNRELYGDCLPPEEEPVSRCRAEKNCSKNRGLTTAALALGAIGAGNTGRNKAAEQLSDCIDSDLSTQKSRAGLPVGDKTKCRTEKRGDSYETICNSY